MNLHYSFLGNKVAFRLSNILELFDVHNHFRFNMAFCYMRILKILLEINSGFSCFILPG